MSEVMWNTQNVLDSTWGVNEQVGVSFVCRFCTDLGSECLGSGVQTPFGSHMDSLWHPHGFPMDSP